MAEPIAVTLCRAVNLWPEVTAKYDVFIGELLTKFDKLGEVQFNQVPEDARNWALQAIDTLNNENPVEECPGFEDVFDVEDHTPMFADNPEEDATEVVEGKAKKGSKGGKRVARGVKKADAAKKVTREARPLGEGKTSRIMDAIFNNPKISVEDIRAELKAEGIETQKTSTTVVRSFYRHSIKHLASKGALKNPIEF